MSGNLPKDVSNNLIQVFTLRRVEAISGGGTYTPLKNDRVFMADSSVSMTMNNGEDQTSVDIPAHLPFGIIKGATYTFATAVNLLVM